MMPSEVPLFTLTPSLFLNSFAPRFVNFAFARMRVTASLPSWNSTSSFSVSLKLEIVAFHGFVRNFRVFERNAIRERGIITRASRVDSAGFRRR